MCVQPPRPFEEIDICKARIDDIVKAKPSIYKDQPVALSNIKLDQVVRRIILLKSASSQIVDSTLSSRGHISDD